MEGLNRDLWDLWMEGWEGAARVLLSHILLGLRPGGRSYKDSHKGIDK